LIVRSSWDAVFCVRTTINDYFLAQEGGLVGLAAYLDGEVVDGAPACCARALERLCAGGHALERGDAGLQLCDLPLLLFELPPLVLDFLMRDGLCESIGGSVVSKEGRR
jgi:hypothetical protein